GAVADRDAVPLDRHLAGGGGVEQQVDEVVVEQVDLVDVQDAAVGASQEPGLELDGAGSERLLEVERAEHPVLRGPDRQLHQTDRTAHDRTGAGEEVGRGRGRVVRVGGEPVAVADVDPGQHLGQPPDRRRLGGALLAADEHAADLRTDRAQHEGEAHVVETGGGRGVVLAADDGRKWVLQWHVEAPARRPWIGSREAGLRTCRVTPDGVLDSPQRACAGLSPASQILPVARPHRFRWLGRGGTSRVGLTIASRLVDDVTAPPRGHLVTVVGVGADGSLQPAAETLLREADVVLGGRRHLELVAPVAGQERRLWPAPLGPALPALMAELRGRQVVALASGDPMLSGIGTTLVRTLGAEAVHVLPSISSVALARARMRWSAEESVVVTLVGRHEARVLREVAPGQRILVLTS